MKVMESWDTVKGLAMYNFLNFFKPPPPPPPFPFSLDEAR